MDAMAFTSHILAAAFLTSVTALVLHHPRSSTIYILLWFWLVLFLVSHRKQVDMTDEGRKCTQFKLSRVHKHSPARTILAVFVGLVFLAPELSYSATPPPLASYDFDAGSGVTLADRSSNDHPGTLVNGPTWTSGKYGGALAFDGIDDYVAMGDIGQADGLTNITVSTWVRFALNGGGAVETHFVDKSTCNGNPGSGPWELGVSLTKAHKAEFVIYPQGGNPSTFVFSGAGRTSIDDGAWHYITGRYDGANLSIWVDGKLENSRALAGRRMVDSGFGIDLGGHCNGYSSYPFKGLLDR